jgi:hypothetical protein
MNEVDIEMGAELIAKELERKEMLVVSKETNV